MLVWLRVRASSIVCITYVACTIYARTNRSDDIFGSSLYRHSFVLLLCLRLLLAFLDYLDLLHAHLSFVRNQKQKTHFTYACNTLNVWISGALESFSIACYLLILIQDAESEFVDSLHIVFLVSTALRLHCYTIAHAQRRIWIMWPLTSNIWCNNSSNY